MHLLFDVVKDAASEFATRCRDVVESLKAATEAASDQTVSFDGMDALFLKPGHTNVAALTVSLPSMMRLTDAVRGALKPGTALMDKVAALLTEVAVNGGGGQEGFVLSLAASGSGATSERLRGVVASPPVMSLPFASSLSHGRPWTASRPGASLTGLQPSLLSSPRPPSQDALTRGKVTRSNQAVSMSVCL